MNSSSNRYFSPRPGTAAGFTLFETLIAVALTAILGTVLFRTWDMVMRSGRSVQNAVREREAGRVAWGVLDNDITAMVLDVNENSLLPVLSRQAIVPSDAWYERTGKQRPEATRNNDEVLLAFATGTSVLPEAGSPGSLFCVEYRLRGTGAGSRALIRRERPFCGVEGEFPWTEFVLMRGLRSAKFQLVMPDGDVIEEREDRQRQMTRPCGLRLVLRRENNDDVTMAVPLPVRRLDIGWSDEE